MYDLNDAQPQMAPMGDLIPDGAFAKVKLTVRPGGINGSAPIDAGLLTASKSSDALLLDCEFTVVEGPFARRKFWQNFTVSGGKLDDKGVSKGWNISKAAFRAMVDSALGLNPKDMSDAARIKRTLRGLKDLDGITFVARIMVEPATSAQYRDANKLAHVVTPDEPQYAAVLRGDDVPPEPVNAKPRKPADAAPAATAPSWGGGPTAAAPNAAPNAAPAWASQNGPAATPAPVAGPAWING